MKMIYCRTKGVDIDKVGASKKKPVISHSVLEGVCLVLVHCEGYEVLGEDVDPLGRLHNLLVRHHGLQEQYQLHCQFRIIG